MPKVGLDGHEVLATGTSAAAKPAPTDWGFRKLSDFMAAGEPSYDWIMPGVLEHGDRLILTGNEGMGKSTLLRQWAVMAAAGVHWFTGREIPPLRVGILDLENSERQIRRAMSRIPYAEAAKRMLIRCAAEGLDINSPGSEDAARLANIAAKYKIDLLVVGPLYKMTSGDPVKEEPAAAAAGALDKVRESGCAILMEAHNAKAADVNRRVRPKEPYGASLWKRWPEFGLHLGDDGQLTHWRGPRDERNWPSKLAHGTPWPWAVDNDAGDEYDPDLKDLQRLYDVISANDGQLSGREVAGRAGLGRTSTRAADLVDRLIGQGLIRKQKAGNSYLHFVEKPWPVRDEPARNHPELDHLLEP